mmetsp:Transcript_36912/g.91884  ORF Transcript_36912/g.91884 Transcript_36912/m.91884 type:complete len:250 (+) Transcript_36912:1070-1819(+)
MLAPSGRINRAMPPTASPGMRGTVSELYSSRDLTETPSRQAIARKARALVSWKKETYRTPALPHAVARPEDQRRWCTSPCPCGFVSSKKLLLARAKCASLSISAATFSCLISVTCASASPKYLFDSRKASVRACVSSEVMMASWIVLPPRQQRAWKARMYSAYHCMNDLPETESTGSAILIPLYPRRSPSPPATSTKAVWPMTSMPAFSNAKKCSEPAETRWPLGTSGVHSPSGLHPALASESSFLALA